MSVGTVHVTSLVRRLSGFTVACKNDVPQNLAELQVMAEFTLYKKIRAHSLQSPSSLFKKNPSLHSQNPSSLSSPSLLSREKSELTLYKIRAHSLARAHSLGRAQIFF